jgi:hypothetical protein
MKKILLTFIIVSAASFTFAAPPVNEKVLKMFRDVFPSVSDAKWYEYEDYYEAYFDKDDVKCRIKYDFNGKVISTMRYYGEKLVCPFLKAKLVQKYPGRSIFGVTEVNSENELTYDIVLEDDKSWMHVRSDVLGQMTTTQKFKKAAE